MDEIINFMKVKKISSFLNFSALYFMRIKSGDSRAMDILVRRWYSRIYGYIFKMLGHEQDAHDVTKDTFLALIQGIKSYRFLNKFQGWIFTIAHNKCMDFFRLQGRISVCHIEDIEDIEGHGIFDVDELLTNLVVAENALDKISVPQREVIILHYFQGFTVREISQMTDTPVPTLKSRLGTAKSNLAKLLREDFA